MWKWTNGQATSITDFGQPTATTDYALCLYAGGAPIADAVVESDVQRWRLLSGKGYSYIDASVGQSGIQRILLKGNATADRSKVFWKGKGPGSTTWRPARCRWPAATSPSPSRCSTRRATSASSRCSRKATPSAIAPISSS